jgi:hypothetical protein
LRKTLRCAEPILKTRHRRVDAEAANEKRQEMIMNSKHEIQRFDARKESGKAQRLSFGKLRRWLFGTGLLVGLSLMLAARPAVAGVTVLFEGFEGRFPEDNQWSVGNASGGAYWDDVTSSFGGEGVHSGYWKGYCAGSAYPFLSSEPNPYYQNNMTAYMSKSLDLTPYSSATLWFWYKIPSIESGYDLCSVKILPVGLCFGCPPGGTVLWSKDSPVSDWTLVTIDLTPYVGSTQILKFEFDSDYSVVAEGWYLDDISVTATGPDYFDGATLLSGTRGSVSGSNMNATSEPDEPSNYGRTVWWKWIAPSTGCYVFDTFNSGFDTILDAYTGATLSSLTSVAHNDNWNGTYQSQVRFMASAGTTYYIRVDGSSGSQGLITLNYALDSTPPANDSFSAATLLSGASGVAYGDNCNATREAGEPAAYGRTVWWKWTAPSTGCYAFATFGSSFDTILEVFTGTALTYLNRVAYDDDTPALSQSRVRFIASAGATYYIRVHGYAGDIGDIQLTWYQDTSAPSNDNFVSAELLDGYNGFAEGDNCNASSEAGEPDNAGRTVWWKWTAPYSGNYVFDTFGSGFDTTLAVYSGAGLNTLSWVAGNQNWNGGVQSQVRFIATSGTTYYIRVDGSSGAQGEILLNWDWDTTAPINDNFASATILTGSTGGAYGDGANATTEPNEPDYPLQTVWWRWTAPASGCCELITYGSTSTTALDVYTGSSLPTLVNVGHATGTGAALLSFAATAGTTYSIRVGWNPGNIAVVWNLGSGAEPPANDNFTSAAAINGIQGGYSTDNCSATSEPGEPPNNGRTVWWRWVAPSTGCYTFDTGVRSASASSFDTILEVFVGTALNNLTRVAYNDNYAYTRQSLVSFHATAGTAYYIRVDGRGGQGGDIVLTWDENTSLPDNDNFVSYATIGGTSGSDDSHSNCNGTTEPGEPTSAGGHTVWWAWTAPANGCFVFDTFGSGFDTVLDVFAGGTVSNLRLLGTSNDANGTRQSQVQFQATAGQTYYVRVDGYSGDQGQILLKWHLAVCPPGLRITRSGGNVVVSWPLTSPGFTLQQSDNLAPNPVWTSVSQTPSQTADEYYVTLPIAKARQFFRLMHP